MKSNSIYCIFVKKSLMAKYILLFFLFLSLTTFSQDLRINTSINYWFSNHFGAKMQAELISTIKDVSIFASFGTSGSGVGVSTSSSFYQFNFGGGLMFRLTSKY